MVSLGTMVFFIDRYTICLLFDVYCCHDLFRLFLNEAEFRRLHGVALGIGGLPQDVSQRRVANDVALCSHSRIFVFV